MASANSDIVARFVGQDLTGAAAASAASNIKSVAQAARSANASMSGLSRQSQSLGNNVSSAGDQFFSFTRRINSLRGAMMTLGIAFTGAQIAKFVTDTTRAAGEIRLLEGSMESLTRSSGENAQAMLQSLRAASQGMISDRDLMVGANTAMMLGVADTTEEMVALLEVARDRGRALGRDTTEAFNSIVMGIGRMSPLILDNLGIVLDLDTTLADYAETVGKTADSLTDLERKQALVNRIMSESSGISSEITSDTESIAVSMERLDTAIANLKVSLGEAWGPLVAKMAEGLAGQINLLAEGGLLADGVEIIEQNIKALEGPIEQQRILIARSLDMLAKVPAQQRYDVWDTYEQNVADLNAMLPELISLQDAYYRSTGKVHESVQGLSALRMSEAASWEGEVSALDMLKKKREEEAAAIATQAEKMRELSAASLEASNMRNQIFMGAVGISEAAQGLPTSLVGNMGDLDALNAQYQSMFETLVKYGVESSTALDMVNNRQKEAMQLVEAAKAQWESLGEIITSVFTTIASGAATSAQSALSEIGTWLDDTASDWQQEVEARAAEQERLAQEQQRIAEMNKEFVANMVEAMDIDLFEKFGAEVFARDLDAVKESLEQYAEKLRATGMEESRVRALVRERAAEMQSSWVASATAAGQLTAATKMMADALANNVMSAANTASGALRGFYQNAMTIFQGIAAQWGQGFYIPTPEFVGSGLFRRKNPQYQQEQYWGNITSSGFIEDIRGIGKSLAGLFGTAKPEMDQWLTRVDTGAKSVGGLANAADDAASALGSMLQSVPGLFGTSEVTADQMRMAELGVPQNFADDYLRRLTDEVMNGVNWDDVSIQDAAARIGMDPNAMPEAILAEFTRQWQTSELFANPANLELINADAVKAALQQQQNAETGKLNIMEMFGINVDEQKEELAATGTMIRDMMASGLTSTENMPDIAGPVSGEVRTQLTSGSAMTNYTDAGTRIAEAVHAAFVQMVNSLPWNIPTPSMGGAGAVPPAGGASGTSAPPAGGAGGITGASVGRGYGGFGALYGAQGFAPYAGSYLYEETQAPIVIEMHNDVKTDLDINRIAYKVMELIERRSR